MVWLVIVAGAMVTIGFVAWMAMTRQHPESSSSHRGEADGVDAVGRGTGSPNVADRPGGPDAENMASDVAGGFTRPGRVVPDPDPASTEDV